MLYFYTLCVPLTWSCVPFTDFVLPLLIWCGSRLNIFPGGLCAATYLKVHVLFGVEDCVYRSYVSCS
jgi:hypothetical protein